MTHRDVDPVIGRELRAIRNALGLPAQRAGRLVGVDHSTVTAWERGDRTISVVQFLDLCNAYAADAAGIINRVQIVISARRMHATNGTHS